jgi:hypothetical protein
MLGQGDGTLAKRQPRTRDAETVNFRCHGAMLWPLYVASMVKADLAISLKREQPTSD